MADLLASNKNFYKIKTTNDEFALQLLKKMMFLFNQNLKSLSQLQNNFLSAIFLMSLVILLGMIINNSNFPLTTDIIGYLAINIFNQILLFLVAKFNWLKWNPLNMMNLGARLQNHNLHKMT